jgi:hypothetical protein
MDWLRCSVPCYIVFVAGRTGPRTRRSEMAKKKAARRPKVGDGDPRMMRVNQRSHQIPDGKKAASKKACRGRVTYG